MSSSFSDPSSKGESSSGNGSIRENNGPDLLQFMGEKGTADGVPISNETRNNGNPAMVSGESCLNLEIASSPFGEVKIYDLQLDFWKA